MKTVTAIALFVMLGNAAAADDLTASQLRFIAINDAVSTAFKAASNPKISSMLSALQRRSGALCQVAPNGVVAGWQAIVTKVAEDGSTFELMVAPTARLNAVVAAGGSSEISSEAPPSIGSKVRISGQFTIEEENCFRQKADLTAQSLAAPIYEFMLTTMSAVQDEEGVSAP